VAATNVTVHVRCPDATPFIVANSLLIAMKLTMTTASVIQKIVHSPSCCASAAAGISSGDAIAKSWADNSRKTRTPISQARMPRVVGDSVAGNSGHATIMAASPMNSQGRPRIACQIHAIRPNLSGQFQQQPGHQSASIR
jgi:hypothetical protein